ncbi:MAG: GerMN domain-containing protein [Eubacteriales bacterium]|nr:GerMN domain-containing protein [Eubacteriales bacterium]
MKTWLRCCVALAVSLLVGCTPQPQPNTDVNGIQLYTLDYGQLRLQTDSYTAKATETQALCEELMQEMNRRLTEQLDSNPDYPDIRIQGLEHRDGLLTVDFLGSYYELDPDYEVLFRAGVVKTFGQIADIQYLRFRINGEMLKQPGSENALLMAPSHFVDIEGDSIKNYTEQTIHLYYATADGTQLKQQTQVIHYNKNIPFEQVLLQTLIKGPATSQSQYRALIPSTTKIINVSISEGTCYVNLDKTATEVDPDEPVPVNPQVSIYGLVNTLTENLQVKQVQIFIEGKSDVSFRDSVDLELPLSAWWELMEEDE